MVTDYDYVLTESFWLRSITNLVAQWFSGALAGSIVLGWVGGRIEIEKEVSFQFTNIYVIRAIVQTSRHVNVGRRKALLGNHGAFVVVQVDYTA